MMPEARDSSFLRYSDKWKLRRGHAKEDHKEERIGCEEDEKGWKRFDVILGE